MKLDLGSLPFAHLLGVPTPKRTASDEEEKKGPPATRPAAHLAGAGAQEEKPKGDDPADAPKEDKPADKPADPPADPSKEDKPADKSQASSAPSAAEAGVRIQTILTHESAAGPYAALGAFLAFSTTLAAEQAVTALQLAHAAASASGSGRRSLDERMSTAPNPDPGPDAPPKAGGEKDAAAAILAARQKARGK
jgi:hypothetical protein